MTDHERAVARALARCTMLPATAEKRFARNIAARADTHSPPALTERQQVYLHQLAWRFRRQMPADLVPPVKPT